MTDPLDALFRPRSIAVIGASRERGTISGELFHNLVTRGFPGPIDPINPRARAVQSVRAYPSVAEVPDDIDLAIIVVPRRFVLDTVEACLARGVRGLVVITAGFGELGDEGRALQARLLERVRARGVRMLGPNCLGILNTDPEVCLNATFAPTWPPHGPVAIASQSGAVGLALLDYAEQLGIGVGQFASTGNKADISGNDLLEYWDKDPSIHVILLYLESLGNPVRFLEIARRVTRRKPIVAVKSGRTAAGAKAATSHTGALAGMDVAVDALLGQAGVIRVGTMDEMFDLAVVLANQPVPRGNRVAIMTNAGGPGIMASDACESHGLPLPDLNADTRDALREFLPAEASVNNPLDMLASAPAEHYERSLQLLLAEPDVDAVLVLFVPTIVTDASQMAAAVERASRGAEKPVLAVLIGTHGIAGAIASLREHKIPAFAFPEPAVLALARAVRYGQARSREPGRVPTPTGDTAAARAVIAAQPSGWLAPEAVRALLTAYGISVPASAVVPDAAAAVAAADRIGYPVAIKLVSDTIQHKTEVGGVQLGLENAEQVERAVARIQHNLEHHGQRDAMQGVLVQAMFESAVETYVGVTQAPGFGALLAFGIGGVNVELWRDVVFRMHPITDVDARDMLHGIRGRALLEGFRGAPPADEAALAEALLRIDQLVADIPELEEMDLNPLLALPPGRGVVAIDARIRIQRGS